MTKLKEALRMQKERQAEQPKDDIVPIFITVDPRRDSIDRLNEYFQAEDFTDFVGLTGTEEQVKSACKKYRVFYTSPDYEEGKTDYAIDHSIFTYLIDPQGRFTEYFAKNQTAEEISKRLQLSFSEYYHKTT